MIDESPDTADEQGVAAILPMWQDPNVIRAFTEWHPVAVEFYRSASAALLEAAQVRTGLQVLDIGTGTGIPAVQVAGIVGPRGMVTATDPSAALLAEAEANARSAGLQNIEFRRAMVEALPFADGSFDAVVSQLGLMFAADLPRALGEVRRVLRPGCRAAFLAWGPYELNPFWRGFRDVVPRYQQSSPADDATDAETSRREDVEPDPRQPFRFADPASLAEALEQAGFLDVQAELRHVGLPLPAPELLLRFFLTTSQFDKTLRREQRQAFTIDVLAAYRTFMQDDGVTLPAVFVLGWGTSTGSEPRDLPR